MKIGEEIKKFRQSKGMSQKDFARPLGIKANSLSQIETGKRVPSDRVLALIAKHYGVSFSAEGLETLVSEESCTYCARPAVQELFEVLKDLDDSMILVVKSTAESLKIHQAVSRGVRKDPKK